MTMEKIYSPALVSFHRIKEIGQDGRNSKVHLVHDEYMDAEIVIKEMPNKDESIEKLFKEAQILYASNHPNVVQIQYACKDEENIYIAMPYYKNGSIKSLMEERFLTVREIIRYSIQFISGLAHIHSKGLFHLDIKPDNILISDTNEALLSDFGLADYADENGWYHITKVYIKHIAPEYFSNDRVISNQFDIFQVGLTIYRMCIKFQEFDMQFNKFIDGSELKDAICGGEFPSLDIFLQHIPKSLINIIKKCLQVDTSKRYQNVRQILNDLSKIKDQGLDWHYVEIGASEEWSLTNNEKITYVVTKDKGSESFSVKKNNRNFNTDKNIKDFLASIN